MKGHKPPSERDLQMVDMHRQGLILEKIGQHFGVTRERVRQVLAKQGITREHGGQSVAVRAAAASHKRERAVARARTEQKWGMDFDLCRELRRNGTIRKWEMQRKSSLLRGIEWHLTFAEWYAVWQASGKLHLRGRGKGKYCMSRIKDAGGYRMGNVHVQLCTDNSKEAVEQWRGKTKAIKGVYCLYPGRELAWLAKVGKVCLGYHKTAEEAGVARDAYMKEHGITGVAHMRGIYIQFDRHCTRNPYRLVRDGKSAGCFQSREAAEAHRAALLEAA